MGSNSKKGRILFVGGGSGGHFYPLIAVAEAINERNENIELFFAGPNPYDAASLEAEKISFIQIGAGKQRRYASFLNILDIFKTLVGVFFAIIKIYIVYPDVVLSKGGYTSVPVIIAAAFFRIPVIVHESDAVMGKANKFGSNFAQTIITTHAHMGTNADARMVNLGIPIRKKLLESTIQDCPALAHLPKEKPIVLVIGGSQGAERINNIVLDTLNELLPNYIVIHQTGEQNYEVAKLSAERLITDTALLQNYFAAPFLDAETLSCAYNRAGVVVSRAGSNSIYEIALHKKPSILIPIPEEISHDQRTNAYTYARTGAAVVMEEGNLTDNLLEAEIERIMQNEAVYTEMATAAQNFGRNDAAANIASLLVDTIEKHRS